MHDHIARARQADLYRSIWFGVTMGLGETAEVWVEGGTRVGVGVGLVGGGRGGGLNGVGCGVGSMCDSWARWLCGEQEQICYVVEIAALLCDGGSSCSVACVDGWFQAVSFSFEIGQVSSFSCLLSDTVGLLFLNSLLNTYPNLIICLRISDYTQ